MGIYLLTDELIFPDPELSEPDGLLAVGGDLSPSRLLLAYEKGIFPWFNPSDPILWWSPDPRGVIYPEDIKVSKSMRNVLNRQDYEVHYDRDFEAVIKNCRSVARKEPGTWISDDITDAYTELHKIGVAHSVEVYMEDELVGGLYGVSLGKAFFGESMFSFKPNTSKIALIDLSRRLQKLDFKMVDCQLYTEHLGSLGAKKVSRKRFLNELKEALEADTLIGPWNELPAFA